MTSIPKTQLEDKEQGSSWNRALAVLFINQIGILALGTMVTIQMLEASRRSSAAFELAVPIGTGLYYGLGAAGVFAVSLASVLISAACFQFRERLRSIVLMSLSFTLAAAFLGLGNFYLALPFFELFTDPMNPI
jgi:hypothetical protein